MRVPGYFCISMLCTNTWTRFKQSGSVVGIKLAVTTHKALQSHSPNSRRGHGVGLIYRVSEVHLASCSACQPVIARLLPVQVHPSWKCGRDPPPTADAVAVSKARLRECLAIFCGTTQKRCWMWAKAKYSFLKETYILPIVQRSKNYLCKLQHIIQTKKLVSSLPFSEDQVCLWIHWCFSEQCSSNRYIQLLSSAPCLRNYLLFLSL